MSRQNLRCPDKIKVNNKIVWTLSSHVKIVISHTVAVNFVRVTLLNAKINGPLEKAVMKRTMEVVTVTLIESEVYDKDISVQYRYCGDIVYLFILVFLSYDYFTNFQISREIYIFSIWFLYVSESALNYLSNGISYTYIIFDKTFFAVNWQPLWNLAKISECSSVTKWHSIDFQ